MVVHLDYYDLRLCSALQNEKKEVKNVRLLLEKWPIWKLWKLWKKSCDEILTKSITLVENPEGGMRGKSRGGLSKPKFW